MEKVTVGEKSYSIIRAVQGTLYIAGEQRERIDVCLAAQEVGFDELREAFGAGGASLWEAPDVLPDAEETPPVWTKTNELHGYHLHGISYEDGRFTVSLLHAGALEILQDRVESLERTLDERDNPPIPGDLDGCKVYRVGESKAALAGYLEDHPLLYVDGEHYSVTAEKQSLLTSALARHQLAAGAGLESILKWNATGQECTVWTYEALAGLALAIAAYVEPLVSRQQALEVEINGCETVEEVRAVVIDYAA